MSSVEATASGLQSKRKEIEAAEERRLKEIERQMEEEKKRRAKEEAERLAAEKEKRELVVSEWIIPHFMSWIFKVSSLKL